MRTKNSIYNFLTSYVPYIVITILGFIKISIFVDSLGKNLFALNQLYINLFAYLALTEAGVGTAFMYRLYTPLIKKKYDEINTVYSGIKQFFKKIGIAIIIIGFFLSFLIPFLIKDNVFNNFYIQLTFMLFILKNAVDYFMFTPRFIVKADQKAYKINLPVQTFRIFEIIVEIILIASGINYLYILIPGIFIRYFQNKFVNKKVFKDYPWIKEVEEKDFSAKRDINHIFIHKIVTTISKNIDIVLISTFLGSTAVSIYAAYNYLIKFAIDSIRQIFTAIRDSFANVLQLEKTEKIRSIINEFFVGFSFIGSVIVVVFYFILNNFVFIWVGEDYIISHFGLSLFLIIVYYNIATGYMPVIKNVLGLFKETKIISIIEGSINLILSLILVNVYGIEGALMGGITAFLLTNFWYQPYLINKKLFNEGIMPYIKKVILNIILIFISIFLISKLTPILMVNIFEIKLINWIVQVILISFFALLLLTIFYGILYKEFKFIINRIIKFINSFIKNKKK